MASGYPGAFDNLVNPTSTDFMDTVGHAAEHSNVNDAVEAVQSTLGLNPQGGSATVAARLAGLGSGSLFAFKTADGTAITNSTTIVNDADLFVTVAASHTYLVTGMFIYDAGSTCDLRVKFFAPAGATFDWSATGLVTGATTFSGSIDRSWRPLGANPGYGGAGAGIIVVVSVLGMLRTAASPSTGTFRVGFAQDTATVGESVIVKAGSFLDVRQVA